MCSAFATGRESGWYSKTFPPRDLRRTGLALWAAVEAPAPYATDAVGDSRWKWGCSHGIHRVDDEMFAALGDDR